MTKNRAHGIKIRPAASTTLSVTMSVLLVLLLLLNGCCGSSQHNSEDDSTVELNFWNTMEGPEAEIMPEIIRQFEEANPGIRIISQPIEFYKARDKFKQSILAGSGPDIMRADRFWLPDFVKNDLIQELKEAEIADKLKDMLPIARNIITYDSKYWAIPISVDSLALFYNKKHLAEKSISVPENFDDFAAAAADLTDTIIGRYGFFIYPNAWYFEPFLFGFGGQYFDLQGNMILNSDPGRKALDFMLHLKDRLRAVPPVSLRSNPYHTMINSFRNGQVSMIFSGPWAIRSIISGPEFKDDNSNLGISYLPEGPHGSFSPTGCQTLVISKLCTKREAALKFIKHMFSTSVQKTLSMTNFGLPARRSVFAADELKRDPYLQTFIRQLQMSRQVISSPLRGEVYAPLGDKIKEVLNGELSPEFALSDFEKDWKSKY